MEQSFIAFLEDSIKKNWDLDALTDYKGATLQYKDVARKIEKLHIIFELSGIKQGDKIAVCGRNSSHWGVTFLAAVTYGAVIVPILHEFKSDNIHNIVNHSEARLLMVGDMVWENLNENAMPLLEGVILMNDYTPASFPQFQIGLCTRSSERTVRKEISAQFPPGTCQLPPGYTGRTGCDQLYFRHDQLFQRSDDSLPRIVVEYPVRF